MFPVRDYGDTFFFAWNIFGDFLIAISTKRDAQIFSVYILTCIWLLKLNLRSLWTLECETFFVVLTSYSKKYTCLIVYVLVHKTHYNTIFFIIWY